MCGKAYMTVLVKNVYDKLSRNNRPSSMPTSGHEIFTPKKAQAIRKHRFSTEMSKIEQHTI